MKEENKTYKNVNSTCAVWIDSDGVLISEKVDESIEENDTHAKATIRISKKLGINLNADICNPEKIPIEVNNLESILIHYLPDPCIIYFPEKISINKLIKYT